MPRAAEPAALTLSSAAVGSPTLIQNKSPVSAPQRSTRWPGRHRLQTIEARSEPRLSRTT